MKIRLMLATLWLISCVGPSVAQEVSLGSLGGVELVAIPLESPGSGLAATIIELRAQEPNAKIKALTNLRISSGQEGPGLHQVWLEGAFGQPTPTIDEVQLGPAFDFDWSPFDSHLLISVDMVGGGAGASFDGITETNDGNSHISQDFEEDFGFGGKRTGFGDIFMQSPTDAFFLRPEFQSDTITFAQLVGCLDNVTITVGVLGDGIIDAGLNDGAAFGYFDNAPVDMPFLPACVPEPPDAAIGFNGLIALVALRRLTRHRRFKRRR